MISKIPIDTDKKIIERYEKRADRPSRKSQHDSRLPTSSPPSVVATRPPERNGMRDGESVRRKGLYGEVGRQGKRNRVSETQAEPSLTDYEPEEPKEPNGLNEDHE